MAGCAASGLVYLVGVVGAAAERQPAFSGSAAPRRLELFLRSQQDRPRSPNHT